MNHFRGQINGFCHSLIKGPESFAASWTDPKPQHMSTEGSGLRVGEAALPRDSSSQTLGLPRAVFPATLLGWLRAGVGFQVPSTLSACPCENIPSLMRSKAFLQPENSIHISFELLQLWKVKNIPTNTSFWKSLFPFFSIKTVWNHFLDEIAIWCSTSSVNALEATFNSFELERRALFFRVFL